MYLHHKLMNTEQTNAVESTALVTIAPTAAIVPAGGLGFGNSRMFKLKPAILEIVQRTTKGARPDEFGKFRVKDTGELFDELHIVLAMAPQEKRVLFPPGGDLGCDPICRSNDGLVPAPDALVPQANKCGFVDDRGYFQAMCKSASWNAWKKSRKSEDKPACQEKTQLAFWERTTQLPFILSVGGKSVSPIRTAMQHVARLAEVLRAKGQNPNIFDFSMKVKAVEEVGRRGTYYVLAFSDIATVKEEDKAKFGELYMQFAARGQEQVAAEMEEALNDAISGEQVETTATTAAPKEEA